MNRHGKPCVAGPSGPEHRRSVCKTCRNAKVDSWRARHRDEYLRRHRQAQWQRDRRAWLARQQAVPFEAPC